MRYLADLVDRAPPAANAARLRPRHLRPGAAPRPDPHRRRDRRRRPTTDDPRTDRARPDRGGRAAALQPGRDRRRLVERLRRPSATRCAGAVEMAAEAFSRDGGLAGVSTGLIDLDKKLGGLHPSDLVILAAPSLDGQDRAGHQHRLQRRPELRLGAAAGRQRARPSTAGSWPSSRWKCRAEQLAMRLLAEVIGRLLRQAAQGRDRRQRVRPRARRRHRDPGERRSTSTTPAASRWPSWSPARAG